MPAEVHGLVLAKAVAPKRWGYLTTNASGWMGFAIAYRTDSVLTKRAL